MAFANRYPGQCVDCSGHVAAGVGLTFKQSGRWLVRHGEGKCPEKAAEVQAEAAPTESVRRNAKPGYCANCGTPIAAGEGRLLGELDDDTERWVWEVHCLNAAACQGRREAARAKAMAEHEAERARLAEVERLGKLFREQGVRPEGHHRTEGEEVPLRGIASRPYGGGTWAVIEPEGPRTAPDATVLAELAAEVESRKAALEAALARRDAFVLEHLPATAPYYRCNPGCLARKLSPGKLYGADLEAMGEHRAGYEALEAECERLGYTSSPDSYHAPAARLEALQQQAALSAYPRSIWYVVNNGADGDYWADNNIITGGAGAVGHRLPWSAELEAQLRAVAERKGR